MQDSFSSFPYVTLIQSWKPLVHRLEKLQVVMIAVTSFLHLEILCIIKHNIMMTYVGEVFFFNLGE
jgi:hypothetical protein